MAVELGGRLKERVVMLRRCGPTWQNCLGRKNPRPFFQCQDSFEWQTYPDGPLGLATLLNYDRSLLL